MEPQMNADKRSLNEGNRQPDISDEEFQNSMECLNDICTRYLQGSATRAITARLLRAYIETVGERIGIVSTNHGSRGIGAPASSGG